MRHLGLCQVASDVGVCMCSCVDASLLVCVSWCISCVCACMYVYVYYNTCLVCVHVCRSVHECHECVCMHLHLTMPDEPLKFHAINLDMGIAVLLLASDV